MSLKRNLSKKYNCIFLNFKDFFWYKKKIINIVKFKFLWISGFICNLLNLYYEIEIMIVECVFWLLYCIYFFVFFVLGIVLFEVIIILVINSLNFFEMVKI